MLSLLEPPLLSRLRRHDRILIAEAGGGFDVYAGLPLAVALRRAGKPPSISTTGTRSSPARACPSRTDLSVLEEIA